MLKRFEVSGLSSLDTWFGIFPAPGSMLLIKTVLKMGWSGMA
jgi:hypothetical protein